MNAIKSGPGSKAVPRECVHSYLGNCFEKRLCAMSVLGSIKAKAHFVYLYREIVEQVFEMLDIRSYLLT